MAQKSRGFGSRLRRAFTGENDESNSTPVVEPSPESDLSIATFVADGALRRAALPSDYRHSSVRIRADLLSATEILKNAIKEFEAQPNTIWTTTVRKEYVLVHFSLARIYVSLGDYAQAQHTYNATCELIGLYRRPTGSELDNHTELFRTHDQIFFRSPSSVYDDAYVVDILFSYWNLLSNIDQDACFEEGGLKLLQEIEDWNLVPREECYLRLVLAAALVTCKAYGSASTILKDIELRLANSWDALNCVHIFLLRARLWPQEQPPYGETFRAAFIFALTYSATAFGIWDPTTLSVLHYYGTSLQLWGYHEAASKILTECYLGLSYRFGVEHPRTKASFKILKECEDEDDIHVALRFNGPGYSEEERLSVAFENTYLNTVVDLLIAAGETSLSISGESIYSLMITVLGEMLNENEPLRIETSEHRTHVLLRARRTLARCRFEEGEMAEALSYFEQAAKVVKRSAAGQLQANLDLLQFYSQDENSKEKVVKLSRSLFAHKFGYNEDEQASAYHRKLTQLNCTHLTWDRSDSNDPIPLRVIDDVGTGAYAVAESIKINDNLYARKSIALPRYNSRRIKETIQNEVSIIRMLAHPHIVQIYCTYEKRSRFCIVLQPLADCDLEAFLEQPHGYDTHEYRDLMWRWLRCLPSTLAFIHSKGIRHKDIKSRNILVKGGEIIFADFGSSYAMIDEGTSVTDGPSFGHTRLYCAPEVITNNQRRRSADIFSLGCIFTELATALDGREISDYFDYRLSVNDDGETHAYYATLDKVQEWSQRAANQEGRILYNEVIAHMLAMSPESRPTALETGVLVRSCFKILHDKDLPTCLKCDAVRITQDIRVSIMRSDTHDSTDTAQGGSGLSGLGDLSL